ncbi:hypothetical protein Tco_1114764 [Tanacetum coccineum]
MQILGLHEEQRISGFVHGLRTRSLAEHLSTNLPSTYKGLMEKTTPGLKRVGWPLTAFRTTKGTILRDQRNSLWPTGPRTRQDIATSMHKILPQDYGHETNQCQELKHQIVEAVKSGQLAHLVKGVKEKKEKTTGTRSEERKKEEKKPTLNKVYVLMISGKNRNVKKRPANHGEIGEITFPPLPNVGSSDPVIIKVYISRRQVNMAYLDGGREQSWPLGEIPLEVTIGEGPIAVMKTLTFVIVKSDSPHNLLLGRTAMQQIRIMVSTVYGAIKFHTPRGIGTIFSEYNSQKPKEEEDGPTNKHQGNEKNVLSCIDTEERMVINDKYPEQKIAIGRQLPTRTKIRLRDLLKRYINVFAWTSAYITGVPRVLMIGGETFNTEHRINMFNHVEPVKQKKRSLAPERNEAIHSQVEELTQAGILREVKYQTWVSNPMVVKKDNEKWKLRVDFTNINKACIREPHPLPAAEQKAEGLYKYRLKCFLDAYKGYHQIPIAEKDEEKTAFFYKRRGFLLQKTTLRSEKCRGHLSKAHRQIFRSSDGKKYEG